MQHIKDGIYTWEAVQAYGPSTPHRVEVREGRVTAWATFGEALSAGEVATWQTELLGRLRLTLEGGTRYGTGAVQFEAAPAPIGKARAHKLHKIMGRVGVPNHYSFAGVALRRRVASLAALTEAEARAVWAALLTLCPEAVEGVA